MWLGNSLVNLVDLNLLTAFCDMYNGVGTSSHGISELD